MYFFFFTLMQTAKGRKARPIGPIQVSKAAASVNPDPEEHKEAQLKVLYEL